MVLRVQLVDGEYRIVLSAEAMEALGLKEGSVVEVTPVSIVSEGHRYATTEEVVKAYSETEPQHREAYRALAAS